MEILNGDELKIITIEEWCGEWLARKEKGSNKVTTASYRGHVKAFTDWLGDGAVKPLQNLTNSD
jgi:hypothetical protein